MIEERQRHHSTPSGMRFERACADMARGRSKVRLIILVADNGNGKSWEINQVCRTLQWPLPADYYVGRVHDVKLRDEAGLEMLADDVLDFFEGLGLLPEALVKDAERYFDHVLRGELKYLTGMDALNFLDWILLRTDAPEPDPLSLMPLFGFRETPAHRYPIRLTGEVGDRPASIVTKLLRVLEPRSAAGLRSFRSIRVFDILKGFPAMLLVDEADTLSVPCLEEIRQICDSSRTPLVLAGTQMLVTRIETSRSLRALATRAGARLTLAPVTIADLQGACPDMRNEILLDVWKASKRNFRVAILIVNMLRLMKQAYPGRPLTKKAVMCAAEDVFAADAGRVMRGRGGEDDVISDVNMDGPAERGGEEVPPAAALRATGRIR